MPQTYNYHPIIPPSDEENASGVAAENGGALPRDCAICMLPVDTSGTGPPGLHVLGRAQYMLTPCQHLFHTECLEKVSATSSRKVSCFTHLVFPPNSGCVSNWNVLCVDLIYQHHDYYLLYHHLLNTRAFQVLYTVVYA